MKVYVERRGEMGFGRMILVREMWSDGWAPPPSPRSPFRLRGCGFSVGRVSRAVCFPITIFSCQVHVENRQRVGLNWQA